MWFSVEVHTEEPGSVMKCIQKNSGLIPSREENSQFLFKLFILCVCMCYMCGYGFVYMYTCIFGAMYVCVCVKNTAVLEACI